jgi:hypothetical protein
MFARVVESSRSSRARYVALASVWCLAALALKPLYPYVDFGVFYSTAIERIAGGQPLEIYSFVARPPDTGLAIPLSYPPLYFFFLTPLYVLGSLLGLDDFQRTSGVSFGQAWMLLATLPFDLLLCRQVLRLLERTHGALPEPRRWLVFACVLLSPLLWLSSVVYQHGEAMMVALILLAIEQGERGRRVRCGLLWGAALSLKATALVPALVWFGWGLGRERRRHTWVTAALAGGVLLAPLVPYMIWRPEQVWYSLVGFERIRPIGGHVLWKLAPFPGLAELSGAATLLAAVAIGLALARRAGSSFLDAGGAHALVLGQVALLLLGKAIFVWYGLALGVFAHVAFAGTSLRRGSLPLAAVGLNLLLWWVQSGRWVGARLDPEVLVRSALWVAVLLVAGALALRGLASARGAGLAARAT